ncbi:auxin efflux carrier [Serendipita vermifera]|nr:auxin efflux carrier [Serendipita vermifera]
MVSTGALIWISCRPLLKMVLCTGSGFILAKLDLFSAMAARGAGQVMLNITMPCLLFSKMVPAFTPQNIGAIGPLLTMGCIYQGLGLLIALVVREFFWVPHRFRSGLLAAGVWSNYGDVPTAVIMSITAAAPFVPGDVDLGVAYISAFILVFFITLFPLGGHHLIARDFDGPDREDEEVKENLRARQQRRMRAIQYLFTCLRFSSPTRKADVEQVSSETNEHSKNAEEMRQARPQITLITSTTSVNTNTCNDGGASSTRARHGAKHVSFDQATGQPNEITVERTVTNPAAGTFSAPTSVYGGADVMSPTATVISPTEKEFNKEKGTISNTEVPEKAQSVSSNNSTSNNTVTFTSRVVSFLRSLLTPATITMAVAFPVALIKPLKGLFVELENSPIPNAPDGRPPLYFIMDTANFLGAASIPLGLICLGTALATMKIPKTLSSLPVGAITAMAIGKLVIQPIIGVLIVNAFVRIGFIDENDKVLRFVTMFFSCMPTSTTQVFFTQVYSGTGEAEHLSAFLIPQYALMFISTTALTAYSLHLLF